MSEFDGITGFDGWRAKLDELVTAAEEAAVAEGIQSRLAVAKRLNAFVKASAPNSPEILALDDIANSTRSALLNASIEERLQSLAERQGELAALTKKLALISDAANEAAASIRLEKAHGVVTALTESVKSLQAFRKVLEDESTDAELGAAIDKLVTSIQSLRSKVEKDS